MGIGIDVDIYMGIEKVYYGLVNLIMSSCGNDMSLPPMRGLQIV